jgi:hypothetical protein
MKRAKIANPGTSDEARLIRLERRKVIRRGSGGLPDCSGSVGHLGWSAAYSEISWASAGAVGEVPLSGILRSPPYSCMIRALVASAVRAGDGPHHDGDGWGTIEFVTLDRQQALAAEREGFRVLGP